MIGERLRKIRRENKIKQSDLAVIIGVQNTTISSYEANKIDPSDKVKAEIAKHFNISLDYMLGVIDDPMPYYNQNVFMKLPDNITNEEKKLLSEFVGYLEFRRK